jgi:hypothetical protein
LKGWVIESCSMVDGSLGRALRFGNPFPDLSLDESRPLEWLLRPVEPLMMGKVSCLTAGDFGIERAAAATSKGIGDSIEPLMVRLISRMEPTTPGLTVAGPTLEGAAVVASIFIDSRTD